MERVADLPHGRRLVVRPVSLDDLDALLELYQHLSTDDLHLRFFSAFRPSRSWLEDWITAQTERGHGLVAELHEPHGPSRIVGDAGYVLLDDGSGELAITIEPSCRGWLGPYLLDALAVDAAERGVPTLQAEILTENRRMLSMVRFREYATLGHGDWTTVRVAIATTRETPVWLGAHTRPRLLVEATGGRWRATEPAQDAGYDVVVCPGPRPGRRGACPMLEGRPCPLADDADAIVVALPLDGPGGDLARGHEAAQRGIPVLVTVAPEPGTGDPPPLPEGIDPDRITTERNPQKLIAILDHLTAGASVSDRSGPAPEPDVVVPPAVPGPAEAAGPEG
ncbi:GNAT family N-acetyltransferase [Actinomarinicola tropica]|uniref:GNAT family N-acetyltransferase n=1 Tax=Actinomarinicola tropica TaxID=2789776 RepID=UPI00189AFFDC|nr:GNAT family N-acetyltransferase [Actinomarinicola tropica]